MDPVARAALDSGRGSLSPALIFATAPDKIQELSELLPTVGSTRYMECLLGAPDSSRVDCLVSVTSTQRYSLARALAARASGRVELSGMRNFIGKWSDPASDLYDRVPVAWFEFDDLGGRWPPVANVCACVAPAYRDPFAELQAVRGSELLASLLSIAQVVLNEECSAEESDDLRRTVERLPDTARWIHLSVMNARAPRELKLYGVFEPATLLPYLSDVGWAGDRCAIERLLGRYCPEPRTGGFVYVDLPITGMHRRETARLGINFAQQQLRVAIENDARRPELLERLVSDGLCTRERLDALRRWPGEGPVVALGANHHARVERWFDVKVVYLPEGSLSAKAYLGFGARRVRSQHASFSEATGPMP